MNRSLKLSYILVRFSVEFSYGDIPQSKRVLNTLRYNVAKDVSYLLDIFLLLCL